MKKHLFIGLSLMAVLLGCSTDEEVSRSDFKALSFETFVGKGTTRAVAKTSFADGDDFGVFAYRHGTNSWSWNDAAKELFMDNVQVSRQSGAWTYAPLKYWEEGINHTFLAYSPYNANYTMTPDGVLWGINTAAKASEQIDLLYSLPEAGSKNLVWQESGTKVVIPFRHALSQIKLSASTDQDYSGYYTARVRRVSLVGIGDTGYLSLIAASAEESPWGNQGSSTTEIYEATTDALDIPVNDTETLLNPGNNLFMQVPQTIVNDGTVYFKIIYDVEATEAGNASNAGTGKEAIVKIPDITWEHNRIYHYKIQMDLQQLLSLRPIEVGEPDVVDWEAGTETKLPEDLTVTIEPTTNGDTPQTATGNAELGITKSNAAGATQTVQIENPEKDDQWMVEVGPELTDAVTTRAEEKKEPAGWLRVCKDGETATETTKLYGKDDATILIKITDENTTTKTRKAEVVIRRALSGVTRIVVTQEAAPAAIIEANSTQFKMEGSTNQLTIINTANAQWALSQTEDSKAWLTLTDADGNTVTSGTAGQVVRATATLNNTAEVRTATITLTRDGQDPVKVEVTQEAPRPMTISSTAAAFSYFGGTYKTIITNPEAGKEGFHWDLIQPTENFSDWLSVDIPVRTEKTATLTFTVQQNTSTTATHPSVKFLIRRAGQADLSVSIGQQASPKTTIAPASLSVNYAAQTCKFDISSPSGIPWTLSSGASWLTLSPQTGSGYKTVTATLAENTDYSNARSGTVTLKRDGQADITLKVTQGKAPIPNTIVTPQKYDMPTANGTFYFQVNAANGRKWHAHVEDHPYPLGKFITFKNGTQKYEGVGPEKLEIRVSGANTREGYLGIVWIDTDAMGDSAAEQVFGGFIMRGHS